MTKVTIVCVEDEPDVLEAAIRELEPLEDLFPIESAENAADARKLLLQIAARGDEVGLIFCDHIMPGETGVDLLVALHADPLWQVTRKVLLTGQAGLDATIKAVNQAGLAHYIAKPWAPRELIEVAKTQLSLYVRVRDLDPSPYLHHLRIELLGGALRRHSSADR